MPHTLQSCTYIVGFYLAVVRQGCKHLKSTRLPGSRGLGRIERPTLCACRCRGAIYSYVLELSEPCVPGRVRSQVLVPTHTNEQFEQFVRILFLHTNLAVRSNIVFVNTICFCRHRDCSRHSARATFGFTLFQLNWLFVKLNYICPKT